MASSSNPPVAEPAGGVIVQPRCPHCLVAHHGPVVRAVSYGAPCPHCGHAHVYTDRDAYRFALKGARGRVRDGC